MVSPFVTGGGEFEFSLQSAEAAILMLPDGGNRYDTMHRAPFPNNMPSKMVIRGIYT